MFCSKCGTEVNDNVQFCTNCGAPINNEKNHDKQPPKNHTHLRDDFCHLSILIKLALTKPFTACTDFVKCLTTKQTLMYFSLMSIIISLLTTFSVKESLTDLFETSINLASKFQGKSLSTKEFFEIRSKINEFFTQYLPTGKIFMWGLLRTIIFYILITLIIFVVYTLLIKKDLRFLSYLKVSLVALTVDAFFTIIECLFSFVSIYISLILLSISSVIIILVLFSGFKRLVKENNNIIYIFAITYFTTNFINNYVTYKLLFNHFINLVPAFYKLNNIF